mmetsp:Transcript_182/g.373  ORF Transcript_182/g.373 Transcript_182/m.373 type:complete len:320 (+) Transcript_182:1766-2725(+)
MAGPVAIDEPVAARPQSPGIAIDAVWRQDVPDRQQFVSLLVLILVLVFVVVVVEMKHVQERVGRQKIVPHQMTGIGRRERVKGQEHNAGRERVDVVGRFAFVGSIACAFGAFAIRPRHCPPPDGREPLEALQIRNPPLAVEAANGNAVLGRVGHVANDNVPGRVHNGGVVPVDGGGVVPVRRMLPCVAKFGRCIVVVVAVAIFFVFVVLLALLAEDLPNTLRRMIIVVIRTRAVTLIVIIISISISISIIISTSVTVDALWVFFRIQVQDVLVFLRIEAEHLKEARPVHPALLVPFSIAAVEHRGLPGFPTAPKLRVER